MPETTMNENGQTFFGENDVRPSRKISEIDPISSYPRCPQSFSQRDLEGSITTTVRAHHSRGHFRFRNWCTPIPDVPPHMTGDCSDKYWSFSCVKEMRKMDDLELI